MKIAITGHRPNKLGNDYDLKSNLIKQIANKIHDILTQKRATICITGMALGIDTLFAKIALQRGIPYIAAVPCINQDKLWVKSSKELYKTLLDNAQEVVYTSSYEKEYTPWCMQIRNEWMVDNCDVLIAVWDGTSGGTANCVKYAKSKDKEIIYINPQKL